MSKRAFASLLAIALCLAPLSQASAVTAKAGASCPKLKTTSIVKGKKFTCIKSGKKLVWDKGVVVKATVAKPKPKPTSTPATSHSDPVCPKLDSADQSGISRSRADALIGMSESQAEECAYSLKWEFRVGQRDSEMFATTKDYRLDRVTVVVMLGVITRVDVG
jgi:hypothetical protein